MILRLVALLSLTASASAAPVQLHHQVRLLDAAGGPVNGEHGLSVVLYDSATSGNAVFSESFTLTLQDLSLIHI